MDEDNVKSAEEIMNLGKEINEMQHELAQNHAQLEEEKTRLQLK